jgi:hypothetical protein
MSSCFFLYQDDENTVIQKLHFNLFSKGEFLGAKGEFLGAKGEFLGEKGEFLGEKAEFLAVSGSF